MNRGGGVTAQPARPNEPPAPSEGEHAIEKLAAMLNGLISRAEKEKLRLAARADARGVPAVGDRRLSAYRHGR